MYNLKSTVHSFNEYITSVQSDDFLPLFYASDRSGQIKIGTIRKEKIEFVGGILAHSQQINSICKVSASPGQGMFATGSNDKTIKLWRPSRQTLEHICKDY
jgi:WD40 repeat protein